MAGPERIDRFEVEAVLGAGAFATVWLARDPVLDLRVAIKVLADNWSRDQDIRARFIEEARVLWQANSPRIIRVHHVSELPDGRPYFVMSWADRGTLRQRMDARFNANTLFSVTEASSITAELARAVGDVHDIRRIHRDLKPGNVLIRSTEAKLGSPIYGLVDDEQLVLADFGLARAVEASAITLVSGSPAYVAPEQAAGLDQLTEKADLYPLGLMMVELMTGSTPVDRSTMAAAAMTGPIDIGAHLAKHGVTAPPELINYLQSITHPEPTQRPPSARDVAQTLSSFADGNDAGPNTPNHPTSTAGGHSGNQPITQSASGVVGNGSQEVHSVQTPIPQPLAGSQPAQTATSKSGLLAGGGVLAVLVIGIGSYFAFFGGETTASTTTTSASVVSDPASTSSSTGSTTSTTATTTAQAADSDIAVSPLPLPTNAAIASDDEFRKVANIAASVATVEQFYQDLDGPEWIFESSESEDGSATIIVDSPTRTARVMARPTAEAAGAGITQIVIVYSDK